MFLSNFLYFTYIFCNIFIATATECNKGDTYPFTKIGKKYYYVTVGQKMNWFEAVHFCRSYNSDLAMIESRSEMQALNWYLMENDYDSYYFWSSYHDQATEGKFVAISTGRLMAYQNWNFGEPNNDSNEDCVDLKATRSGMRMNDNKCNAQLYPICELRNPPKSQDDCDTIPTKCVIRKMMEGYRQSTNIFHCKE
ncbi:lithostathine [Ceratitis capitata]|uniref:(Mediterranean fruit fly) hypothetical protein n=1 Tax=Ceratitis capitata TaxID=7213 RepID=W8AAH0_CERCA|nr:lithostathine [Ceratitis capitata]CAD6993670.1 unnamed protein product [Ceratitis capitata]